MVEKSGAGMSVSLFGYLYVFKIHGFWANLITL